VERACFDLEAGVQCVSENKLYRVRAHDRQSDYCSHERACFLQQSHAMVYELGAGRRISVFHIKCCNEDRRCMNKSRRSRSRRGVAKCYNQHAGSQRVCGALQTSGGAPTE
jgi:hypothetical protein